MVADLSGESLDPLFVRLRALLAKTDQADWCIRLDAARQAVHDNPVEGARAVLALFEPPFSFGTLSVTRNGVACTEPGSVEREDAFAFPVARSELYREALALWNGLVPPDYGPAPSAPHKLAGYGGGCEVWRVGDRFILRYDCGAHVSKWRDDEVSPAEARQAALGPVHFNHAILALQARLTAAGVDAYAGSFHPLDDPQ